MGGRRVEVLIQGSALKSGKAVNAASAGPDLGRVRRKTEIRRLLEVVIEKLAVEGRETDLVGRKAEAPQDHGEKRPAAKEERRRSRLGHGGQIGI